MGSYNKYIKIMLDLPFATHRSLIEPLTGHKHLFKILVNRFLAFLDKIVQSSKEAIKMLLDIARSYVRSTVGSNSRESMLLVGKSRVVDVCKGDGDCIPYFELTKDEAWKVNVIEEIIDIKNNSIEVEYFNNDELDMILNLLCTS